MTTLSFCSFNPTRVNTVILSERSVRSFQKEIEAVLNQPQLMIKRVEVFDPIEGLSDGLIRVHQCRWTEDIRWEDVPPDILNRILDIASRLRG